MIENLSKLGGGSVLKIIELLLILGIGYLMIRIVIHEERKLLKKSTVDPSAHVAIVRCTRIVLWVLLLLTLLSQAGIGLAPFIAVLSAAGAAVALALKDSLANVAGGFILIVTKPFTRGDEIKVGDLVGTVDYIDLMTTTLHTFEGHAVIIPNGNLTNAVIVNRTKEGMLTVNVVYQVARGADLDECRQIILKAAEDEPLVLDEPKTAIHVAAEDERSVTLSCYIPCRTEDRWNVTYRMNERVPALFDEAGIPIPITKYAVVNGRPEEERPPQEGEW